MSPFTKHYQKKSGNSQKINSAHILVVIGPLCEIYYSMVRLAQYRFILEKIDNNRISSKMTLLYLKIRNEFGSFA